MCVFFLRNGFLNMLYFEGKQMIKQTQVFLKLPEKIIGELNEKADERGVTRASIIKQLIFIGLKNEK